ncbi:MAG: Asp-tRNA(Asn)/Glu-tRNA(Gln) amidotransferase subunit GatC [Desulfuromonadales bacterium]|nr:Asp-tRNA(Asn)/Glu-tRNA(Gln) amidotransferase subunit GatC [Desulfuromonadales bacterium]MBN2792865.1 Asp-tRNA(Asn)/Glu-tRNA(Gln) amidotransferase subunit GatC [Desulfuromonadales bacterium]
MKISQEDVAHVARLARLSLEAQELETLTSQIDAILGYVDKLNELDTEHVEPMAHAVPMSNAFRDDELNPSLGLDRAMQNAPLSGDGCFMVPKVIE